MVVRFRPKSSCGVCMPVLRKPLSSFQIFLRVASSLESMDIIDAGDSAIRQYVCIILELFSVHEETLF